MFSFNLKMHSSKEIYEYVLKNNQKIKPNKMEKIVKIYMIIVYQIDQALIK